MQIITGIYRGKKIIGPSSSRTRPTLQRAKETMFNILPYHTIEGRILDVFAGTGQLSLESLSRGASFAIVNDLNYDSHIILKKNFSFIDKKKYQFYQSKYLDLLKDVKNQKFKVIFVDPPFSTAKKMIDDILTFIDNNQLLEDDGCIIGEIPSHDELRNNYQNIRLIKNKKFSKLTRIWLYDKK